MLAHVQLMMSTINEPHLHEKIYIRNVAQKSLAAQNVLQSIPDPISSTQGLWLFSFTPMSRNKST